MIASTTLTLGPAEDKWIDVTVSHHARLRGVQFTGQSEMFDLLALRVGTRNLIISPETHPVRLHPSLIVRGDKLVVAPAIGAQAHVRNCSGSKALLCMTLHLEPLPERAERDGWL